MLKFFRGLGRDLVICLSFYSRLPLGALARSQAPWSMADFAVAARLAPLAGALLGAIAAAVLLLASRGLELPPLVASALGLTAALLTTGALHEDGLADLADGFGGGATRARKLEIMRDSRIGSFGALALMMSLTLRIGTLAAVTEHAGVLAAGLALMGGAAASRGLGLVPLAVLRPARADGLAHSAGRLPRGTMITAAVLAVGFGSLLPALAGMALWRTVLACLATAAGACGIAGLAHRQIGGQTGDVSGAAQQIGEIAYWLALCLAPRLG